MSKTPFSNKCDVLGELWLFYGEEVEELKHEEWKEFWNYADIGLPLAYMIWKELVTINPIAVKYIDEAWDYFCKMIKIDPEEIYEGIEDAWNASPNPRIEYAQE